jgi:hypothetical protein
MEIYAFMIFFTLKLNPEGSRFILIQEASWFLVYEKGKEMSEAKNGKEIREK